MCHHWAHMNSGTIAFGAYQIALQHVELNVDHINLIYDLCSARLWKLRLFMYVCTARIIAS